MTVEELSARMTSRELTEWRAFSRFEPIGEAREDYRAAVLAYMHLAVNSKKPPAFKKILSMFDFWQVAGDDKPEELSPEVQSVRIKQMLGISPDNKPLAKGIEVKILDKEGNPISA